MSEKDSKKDKEKDSSDNQAPEQGPAATTEKPSACASTPIELIEHVSTRHNAQRQYTSAGVR